MSCEKMKFLNFELCVLEVQITVKYLLVELLLLINKYFIKIVYGIIVKYI